MIESTMNNLNTNSLAFPLIALLNLLTNTFFNVWNAAIIASLPTLLSAFDNLFLVELTPGVEPKEKEKRKKKWNQLVQ